MKFKCKNVMDIALFLALSLIIGLTFFTSSPALIKNYKYPHGEEGYVYVDAVVAYEEAAVSFLLKALDNPEWLVRTRTCDSLLKIGKKIGKKFQCEQG